MMSRSTSTWVSSGMLMVLAAFIWVVSGNFPSQSDGYPGPGLFPRIIAIGLAISGLALLLFQRSEAIEDSGGVQVPPSIWRLIGGIACGLLFPFVAPYIGLGPGAGLVCLGVGLLFGLQWWKAITISLGTSVFLYLIFTLALGITL